MRSIASRGFTPARRPLDRTTLYHFARPIQVIGPAAGATGPGRLAPFEPKGCMVKVSAVRLWAKAMFVPEDAEVFLAFPAPQ